MAEIAAFLLRTAPADHMESASVRTQCRRHILWGTSRPVPARPVG
jgi:hypothetical protein